MQSGKRGIKLNQYDVIIIGAGPSGIFCAYELIHKRPEMKVLIIEKGRTIEEQTMSKAKDEGLCGMQAMFDHDRICRRGRFSDGKLSLSPDVGGTLPEILGYEKATKLIHEADEIYLKFGADHEGLRRGGAKKRSSEIRTKAIQANLKLIECPIRHLGTEEGYKIYTRLQNASAGCRVWRSALIR